MSKTQTSRKKFNLLHRCSYKIVFIGDLQFTFENAHRRNMMSFSYIGLVYYCIHNIVYSYMSTGYLVGLPYKHTCIWYFVPNKVPVIHVCMLRGSYMYYRQQLHFRSFSSILHKLKMGKWGSCKIYLLKNVCFEDYALSKQVSQSSQNLYDIEAYSIR